MLLIWLAACGGPQCEVGVADASCQCAGGYPGLQSCDADGRWSECACDIPTGPTDSGGGELPGSDRYWQYCAPCHGATGGGTGTGPSLVALVPTLTDETIATTIRDGRNNMPAFTSFSDAQIDELVAFLRARFGG